MFKNPFSFEGRIRRREYGLSYLIYIGSFIVMGGISTLGEAAEMVFILFFPAAWFMLAQSAKRCHDLGNSGWYQLIPFYRFIILLLEGNIGNNEYGADPKVEDQTDLPIDMV